MGMCSAPSYVMYRTWCVLNNFRYRIKNIEKKIIREVLGQRFNNIIGASIPMRKCMVIAHINIILHTRNSVYTYLHVYKTRVSLRIIIDNVMRLVLSYENRSKWRDRRTIVLCFIRLNINFLFIFYITVPLGFV